MLNGAKDKIGVLRGATMRAFGFDRDGDKSQTAELDREPVDTERQLE